VFENVEELLITLEEEDEITVKVVRTELVMGATVTFDCTAITVWVADGEGVLV